MIVYLHWNSFFAHHALEKRYRLDLIGRITVNMSGKPPHNTSGAWWRSSGKEPRDLSATISGDPSLGLVPVNQLRLRLYNNQKTQRRIQNKGQGVKGG